MNGKTTYVADSPQRLLQAVLASGVRTVAPVEDEGLVRFAVVEKADAAKLDYDNSRWSPKEVLFPKTEQLLSYDIGNQSVEMKEGEASPTATVLFGVRPCDAAGLTVLDRVFLAEPVDAPYQARREATTVVGLSCTAPRAECFCTSVGLSPTSTEGSDVLLTPLDGKVLVEVVTDKGAALVGSLGQVIQPGELPKDEVTKAAEERITPRRLLTELVEALEQHFESQEWEELARRCLGCGTCAYVCPTCHCFDLVDEADMRCGVRCRNWDACQFALFTLHASGHNPRTHQGARYRQRVLHKFSYFARKHGRFMCVGCGRCLAACPVGMDIAEVAEAVGKKDEG